MKVLVLNIDSVIPNLALEKIRMYHQCQGDEIMDGMPMNLHLPDKVYASCVFTKNREVVENYKGKG